VHSLRSSAAILHFAVLEKLLKAQEEVLTAVRKGRLTLDAEVLALCKD
jgi:chemotaxis protein histidine kinase CheA